MFCWQRWIISGISILVLSTTAYGEEISREQIKGLDEQVQEIKNDVLGIAAELNQLEEKLLYPSGTQVAVFVSVLTGETFRLDSVAIELDGKAVSHHLYTFKELEALQNGGVQRIYTGNVRSGQHNLHVSVTGKTRVGDDLQISELFKINKDISPAFVEIALSEQGITLNSR